MAEKKTHLAVIAAQFHQKLSDEMIQAAVREADTALAVVSKVIRVAGSYEMPLVADQLLKQKKIDALVVLGYIEKGQTLHGEVMGHVVHSALINLQLKYGKPIGVGIIGPGATRPQAEKRKIGAATGAVRAVLRSLAVLRELA